MHRSPRWLRRVPFASMLLVALLGLTVSMCADRSDVMIGVILPLTGPAGSLGQDAKNGMELAVSVLNERGGIRGRRVAAVFEDDQGKPDQAAAAARKLIGQDKVRFIVGPLFSSTTLAAAPIAERSDVILFSPGASNPSITGAGDFVFRNYPSDNYEGTLMARYAFRNLGFQRIAVLYVNNDYGRGLADVFRRAFDSLGGRVMVEESYEMGASDFRTALAKVKGSGAEAIYVPGYYAEVSGVARQARELGLRQQLLGTVGADDPKTVELGGSSVEGMLLTTPAVSLDSPRSTVREFVSVYRARFGKDPGFPAMHTYDTMEMLAKAMSVAGFRTADVRDSLYGIRDFDGVTGTISIDRNGDVVKPFFLKTIKDGRFTIADSSLTL